MGCDIHLFVEMRSIIRPNWEAVNRRIHFEHYDSDTFRRVSWGEERNYDTFAMLADVRNGRGFAGVDTGDRLQPIAPPRGLPNDCSSAVDKEAESWGGDGHSHSWLTLRELLNLEKNGYWNKTIEQRGVVSIPEFDEEWEKNIIERDGQHLLLNRAPRECWGSINGPGVDPNTIYKVRWNETYRESDSWLQHTISSLRELTRFWPVKQFFMEGLNGDDGKYPVIPEDEDRWLDHWVDAAELVRIVFWFDN